MQYVKIAGANVISSLGLSAQANFEAVRAGRSGLGFGTSGEEQPLSLIDRLSMQRACAEGGIGGEYTRFEQLCILSIQDAMRGTDIAIEGADCLVILATTKGNIGLLEGENTRSEAIHLWSSARKVAAFFGLANRPMVVSNACTSGVIAQVTALRLLKAGGYKHVVVCGADLVSEFVLSGFSSFKALSTMPCRPFDANRDGLSLGEGAGTLVFTTGNGNIAFEGVRCVAGGSSNDANHISGPSRTGDGLALAMEAALLGENARPEFISAHGTATPYNDEMEAKAIERAGLTTVPMNSLKGYFGHTLGAAGVIETVTTLLAMREGLAIGTLGHTEYGVSVPLALVTETRPLAFDSFIKIGSGFGGSNAAVFYSKY